MSTNIFIYYKFCERPCFYPMEGKIIKKYVYSFSEGNSNMKDILGGKGANLAEMTHLGMPVPYGFTVSTEACSQYYKNAKQINSEIESQIIDNLNKLENLCNKKLGSDTYPLLLSVRSGARTSMPGMMDTILNLGINDKVVEGLCKTTRDHRFAYDSFRRFIQMFSDVVMEIPKSLFEDAIEDIKKIRNIKLDTELNVQELKTLVNKFKEIYKANIHQEFPSDPKIQLMEAIKAVFRSWDNPRANVYRRMNRIPYSWGTAVNIQTMVFGNFGNDSGSGVAFSRNPSTGENKLFGEYLINAQGEDIVAGIRTPHPIDDLKLSMPSIYTELCEISKCLEEHYLDMQDMEFTIEKGKLYMLQTRNGKRTATAALKIAYNMVEEKRISKNEALLRISPNQLTSLLHPQFEKNFLEKSKPIGKGLAASPGAACGKVVFNAEDAKTCTKNGEKVVLVRLETSPEDIEGMSVSEGILTARGGMTSHAAVVARGIGTCCVSGCGEIQIDEKNKSFTLGGKTINEGTIISLDGSTGYIYDTEIPTTPADISGHLDTFMKWADSKRKLKIFANADTPKDVHQAITFGAEGVGLCRTEHMFFEGDRINAIREMIIASTKENRKNALNKILPYQKEDFIKMFLELKGLPITVRLLDPPLHEFLPKRECDIQELAKTLNVTTDEIYRIIENLKEFNPMMGHRGCRLDISYPEIAEMQTSAIISAAVEVSRKHPEYNITPEIMVPLVGDVKELKYIKNIINNTANQIINSERLIIKYKIGTMIEVPRAVITSDKIAQEADFFSFGTNDLTQMTFGFSRDDASKFLKSYYDNKILESDPFEHLDIEGVGYFLKTACSLGKKTNPSLKIGVCGEHGGDADSIEFFNSLDIDYVSSSPFRVPAARLAAAQAQIKSDIFLLHN